VFACGTDDIDPVGGLDALRSDFEALFVDIVAAALLRGLLLFVRTLWICCELKFLAPAFAATGGLRITAVCTLCVAEEAFALLGPPRLRDNALAMVRCVAAGELDLIFMRQL
jgi:hypothetical protein